MYLLLPFRGSENGRLLLLLLLLLLLHENSLLRKPGGGDLRRLKDLQRSWLRLTEYQAAWRLQVAGYPVGTVFWNWWRRSSQVRWKR